ncbi:MAG: two-component regulator propeller domain-containing protein [Bacteroidota bacterium]|nr:two-component regulator propeller domain-containing protein [Bacteroidota bacterium]
MKKELTILFIFISLLANAQYQFSNYTTYNTGSNSLGSNTIYYISENPITNHLYISSFDNLMKYDNIDFSPKYDIIDPSQSYTTGERFIFDCDNSGNLWFEFQDTLNKYDGANITQYPLPSSSYHSDRIYCDSQGNIWIATTSGLLKFNGSSFELFNTSTGLAGDYVSCIYEDTQGYIWVGTHLGISMFNGNVWTTYNTSNGLQWSNNGAGINCISEDETGAIWAGGIEIAYLTGNTWTVLNPAQLTNSTDDIVNIVTIVNDTINNRLWFGTEYEGLFYKEGTNWYRHTINEGLPSNRVNCGLLDSQDRLWFGMKSGGLCKYESANWTYYTTNSGLCENWINDICESVDNEIWAATQNGISKFNLVQWESYFTNFESNTKRLVNNDFDNNVVVFDQQHMYRYSNSTWDSIYVYSGGGGTGVDFISEASDDYWSAGWGTKHFFGPDFWNPANWIPYSQGLPDLSCLTIERDSSGVLWVGTMHGMAYLQGSVYIPINIPNDDFGYRFLDIRTDYDGNLWIASNYGLACKSGTTWEFYFEADGLADNYVNDIEIASDSSIWFATLGGVSVLTDTGMISIKEQDGLVHRHARSLKQDHLGNMWIGTQHGISMLHNAVQILENKEIKSQTSIEIFPNPAKNTINISSSSEIIPIAEIEIYNLSGQLLRKTSINKNQQTIDISGLSPGNYFIRATGKNDVWVKKFVVMR